MGNNGKFGISPGGKSNNQDEWKEWDCQGGE